MSIYNPIPDEDLCSNPMSVISMIKSNNFKSKYFIMKS